jgi:hypothetical protein
MENKKYQRKSCKKALDSKLVFFIIDKEEGPFKFILKNKKKQLFII